ncbi:MAG: acyl--CoA ligase, partial [Deltaproteobacteria bacterium]|nr:acyl--CoA ligase [Deltaproteobacteria bacterium]
MRTIRYLVDKRAEEDPDRIYMIAPEADLCLTYGRLKQDAVRLGNHLMKMGLRKGDKLSFMSGNGYQAAKIFLGSMYAGFVIAPLNLMAQPSQLAYVLEHSDTKLVFFTEDQKEKLETASDNVRRPVRLVPVDNDAESIFPHHEDPSGLTLPEVNEEDDALLLYTSGTTGSPKGVILSHKNMVAGGEYTAAAHGLLSGDRALCSLPLYHINGEVVT